ncbi:MAG: hypothetical protein PF904_13140 [Kiritimatiellae bacterium]|nr:hypothetical protein [Kiritimatiellia bacterium]
MNTIVKLLVGLFVGSYAWTSTASDIYVDVHGTPATDSKTWNSVSFGTTGESGFLVDKDGDLTTVKVDVTAVGLVSSVASQPFTGEAAEFEPARSPDSKQYYRADGGAMTADVTGLDPSSKYTFTFVGQRIYSGSGLTRYTVAGANSGYDLLETKDNTSSVAIVTGITPTSSGVVTLSVQREGSAVPYILAFKIQQVSNSGTFYVDSISSASADPNGYFWNALPFTVYRDPRILTNRLGVASGYTITLTSTLLLSAIATIPLEGDAAEFEPARTSLSYPTGQAYGNNSRPKGSLVISNLVPDRVYNFTFTGSRGYLAGTAEHYNFKTLYRATGFNTVSNTLVAHYNTSSVARVENVFSSSDGTITLDVTAAADNNSENTFYIIGFKMDALSPIAFPVIVEQCVGGTVASTTHTSDGGGLYWVDSGDSITLEATAKSGWTFVGWGGPDCNSKCDKIHYA